MACRLRGHSPSIFFSRHMITLSSSRIASPISVHRVGNKALDEPLSLSREPLSVDPDTSSALMRYFLSSFRNEVWYHFTHDVSLSHNTVQECVRRIFEDPSSLHAVSSDLAKYLYGCCSHPRIKGGELYVVLLEGCLLDDCNYRAVGLFKSESSDTFLEVGGEGDVITVRARTGVDVRKLDKGALVLESGKEDGYRLLIVDNTSRGSEAQYWSGDFLGTAPVADGYFHTENVMEMTRNFVVKELPKTFSMDQGDKASILARGEQYFREKDTFGREDFAREVFGADDSEEGRMIGDTFERYAQVWQEEKGVELEDGFDLNSEAVKHKARTYRSVIKLDRNFHIYVHGGQGLIEKGYDPEAGKSFYRIYFDQES